MDLTELLTTVSAIILAAVATAFALLLGRKISQREEVRANKELYLKRENADLMEQLHRVREAIEEKELEIEKCRSEVAEKNKDIAELQERLRFAEKVTERDLRTSQALSDSTSRRLEVILSELVLLQRQLETVVGKEKREKK